MKRRKLPNGSLREWQRNKPRPWMVKKAFDALVRAVPGQWRPSLIARGIGQIGKEGPEWLECWDALTAIREFEDRFGNASSWNLSDYEICQMAKRLAAEAQDLDDFEQSQGSTEGQRVDTMRLLVRMVGLPETAPLVGLPGIKRVQDDAWWRRQLRRHVARVMEAGYIRLGIVSRTRDGYASNNAVLRRQAQQERNQSSLKRTLYKNEAGQIWSLAELAALSPSNPIIRGGELMTRIRGAEEYADARNHVGLFLTLTVPSRFHAMTVGGKGGTRPNPKYDGVSTPRDSQMWLRSMWSKVRAKLERMGVRMYGIRVAEPHHDATPHWHALVWTECEDHAQCIEAVIRHYWLSEDGDEPGAQKNRINVKRMTSGGAASYVAKYIAKSVGHAALADHLDEVQGELWDVSTNGIPGHRRVDAWASHWGIRQFQAIGMPSVCVWRELRRVTRDQIETARRWGDPKTVQAWYACQRHGDIKADWRAFMEAMGGHCRGRGRWLLGLSRRMVPEGATNRYGDALTQSDGVVMGLQTQTGRHLISRRMGWTHVAAETETFDAETCTDACSGKVLAVGDSRAALPPPWTGFNNCTGRLTGELRRSLFGRGVHEKEDWTPKPLSLQERYARAFGLSTTPVL